MCVLPKRLRVVIGCDSVVIGCDSVVIGAECPVSLARARTSDVFASILGDHGSVPEDFAASKIKSRRHATRSRASRAPSRRHLIKTRQHRIASRRQNPRRPHLFLPRLGIGRVREGKKSKCRIVGEFATALGPSGRRFSGCATTFGTNGTISSSIATISNSIATVFLPVQGLARLMLSKATRPARSGGVSVLFAIHHHQQCRGARSPPANAQERKV